MDEAEQLSLFKSNEAKLIPIGFMVNEITRYEHHYFESPNPKINAVFNKTQLTYKSAKSFALRHFSKLDWNQMLEEGGLA